MFPNYKLKIMADIQDQTLDDFTEGDIIEFIDLSGTPSSDTIGIVIGKDEAAGFLDAHFASQGDADSVWVDPKYVRKLAPILDELRKMVDG